MIELSEQQISDAQANDLDAVTAIVQATEPRLTRLARQYATGAGRTDEELAQDLTQIGRIAVWEAIRRFEGEGVTQFLAYVDRTVKGALSDARKTETRPGVSRSVAAAYETALSMAGGDPYEAESLVTSREAMGERNLSREMAYAARLSWQGVEYLDAPIGETETGAPVTLADRLPGMLGIPEDLIDPRDIEDARRKDTRARVNATLKRLGWNQWFVLKATYGISPVPQYGTAHDEDIAAAMGIDPKANRTRISSVRKKGHDRFRELWLKGAHS